MDLFLFVLLKWHIHKIAHEKKTDFSTSYIL